MSAALKAAIQRTGRSCGTCSLCCKLPEIVVLNKPANTWCQHRTPGNGCGIYQTRPTKCQNFGCGWLTDTGFGDVWFPARASALWLGAKGTVTAEAAKLFVMGLPCGMVGTWLGTKR